MIIYVNSNMLDSSKADCKRMQKKISWWQQKDTKKPAPGGFFFGMIAVF
jgi:hypothetical protein